MALSNKLILFSENGWVKKVDKGSRKIVEITDVGRDILNKLLEMRDFEITLGLRMVEEG